ncbi:hydrogenase expression/formation protein [Magnetovibrio sp.]|uniref:hydrogenase expression/formation protein n=1 Tax=Magnetovibrio sp. TaxID=2024836 RepID=UPI002F959962
MKMFEWDQDEGVELNIPSINGNGLDVLDVHATDNALRLARAEELARDATAGIEKLREIAGIMASQASDGASVSFSLNEFDEKSRELIGEVLGRGEVSGHMSEPQPLNIQESIFPGLWRVKNLSRSDEPEVVIIADVPLVLRLPASETVDANMVIPEDAKDTMNALPVLAEIRDRALSYQSNRENHIINFTLLPMSQQDMDVLRDTLGAGHIDLVSTGYGACRVCSTRWPHVWSVQYFNSMDKIILDTLEIGDIPAVVRASKEDFHDSAERILEIIEAYL